MKLKDCPFCGYEPIIVKYNRLGEADLYFVECSRCGVETTKMIDKEDVVVIWNRRAEVKE